MFTVSDTALMLRAHAEHHWMQTEISPTLSHLEQPAGLGHEEMQAAVAYLQMAWSEAVRRAAQSDLARERLDREAAADVAVEPLTRQARRYHDCVQSVRAAMHGRVEPFLGDRPALFGLQ